MSAPAEPFGDYVSEIRFGVVMYGGVSLAIYINGVTNELFEMACATPRPGVAFDLEGKGEPATREIYRRLSYLASDPNLRGRYAAAIRKAADAADAAAEAAQPGTPPPAPADAWPAPDAATCARTRFVVDVIAGTSAGGINGIFLAKALANGEQFGVLQKLWVDEGDIGLLLNDKRSYPPPLVDRSGKPTSLLNSDRMYQKLREAMEAMVPLKTRGTPLGGPASPLAEQVDLFVTTTDIRGSVVPLRLFDKVVHELRYKQSYHFSYPDGPTPAFGGRPAGNDFAALNTSFLAFAARCTSSFPFAFEPMTLAAVTRLKADGEAPGVARWKMFFPNLPRPELEDGQYVHRAFGDGGYLDNKPFTYIVDTLSTRFASVPMERKLVFIEPAPHEPDAQDGDAADRKPPDALENSLAALSSIPRYETIREDLQAVLARNRRIERVERLVRLCENDLESDPNGDYGMLRKARSGATSWSTLKLSDMVACYGAAYLPYQRLRLYTVTDDLADRLSRRWRIDDDTDDQYALRAIVRVWRERHFDDEGTEGRQTVNAFLDQFDLDYRLRRFGLVLRKIDQLTRLFYKRCGGVLKAQELSELERALLAKLNKPSKLEGIAPLLDENADMARVHQGLRVLLLLKAGLLDARNGLSQSRRAIDQPPDEGDPQAAANLQHEDLHHVLQFVLGQTSDAQPSTIEGFDLRGVVDEKTQRPASVSRTLQENVTFRAHALLEAAEKAQRTGLQKALENDIERMRIRSRPGSPEAVGHDTPRRIVERAWALLGRPQLDNASAGPAALRIGPAEDLDGTADRASDERLATLNSDVGRALRTLLGMYYARFDPFDQMSYPLYYDTGTGEPSTVEVVRISPVDATNLIDEAKVDPKRHKLAGTALGNFGAFLDRRWRCNDIMWGRLDGAERLIEALLPLPDDDSRAVRKELIERAQQGILRETLVPDGHAELAQLMVAALDALPGRGDTRERLRQLLDTLWTGDSVARDRLGGVLVSLLDEPGLMRYMRCTHEVDPEPDPKTTLDSAARAVTITGKILEGISTGKGATSPAPRWIARLGLMLQGIVAVSLPGTLKQRWWTHGVKVLYAFEVFAIVVAILFGSSDMRTLAFTAFGATLGIHLLTLIAGDVMRERKRWLYIVVAGVFVILALLALLGALVLFNQQMQQQWCWSHGVVVPDRGFATELCGWLGRHRGGSGGT